MPQYFSFLTTNPRTLSFTHTHTEQLLYLDTDARGTGQIMSSAPETVPATCPVLSLFIMQNMGQILETMILDSDWLQGPTLNF